MGKSVFVCSFYKPQVNDLERLHGLRDSLSKIPRLSLIWLLGDFNLPQIDWDTEQIKQNCSYTTVYDSFLEIIHDFGLEQIVKIPTRNSNTLNLFLLNLPSLVHSTKTLPPLGQGDHDIAHHELEIYPGRRKQKQRHIKLYKKTNWAGFREEMKQYQQTYVEKTQNRNTNTKWKEFKGSLNKLTEKYAPTKLFKPKDGHPCVTLEIKRLMHKRDRLYSKHKQNRPNPNIKNKFNHLKHIIKRKLRESYNQYIDTIVTAQNEENTEFRHPNKRLYTFVKQQKSDSNEITSLKSNGITHTATVEKANVLNTQFQSVLLNLFL